MKKYLLIITISLISAFQMMADPVNRLGQSLSTVESQVEGLRHIRNWSSQGDLYTVYHNTEAYTSYYFKNGIVVKEEFTYSGDESHASYYFDRFVNDFASQNYNNATEDSNSVTFFFPSVKVIVSLKYFTGNEYLCKVTFTRR